MQALKAEVLVFHILVQLIGLRVLKLHFFVFSNGGFLASHHVIDLFSIFYSANHTLAFNNFLELVKAYFIDLVSFHCLSKECFHLVSLFN